MPGKDLVEAKGPRLAREVLPSFTRAFVPRALCRNPFEPFAVRLRTPNRERIPLRLRPEEGWCPCPVSRSVRVQPRAPHRSDARGRLVRRRRRGRRDRHRGRRDGERPRRPRRPGGRARSGARRFDFSPTVITGTAGGTLTLHLENEGSTEHNFSVTDQGIDQEREQAEGGVSNLPTRARWGSSAVPPGHGDAEGPRVA